MDVFWFWIVLFMIAMYAILDGYDFGLGIWYLFLPKSEKDKQRLLSSISPFWDGNEVWLIAGGGVLFMAFPLLYASAFSGFYLPLMMILWFLMMRGISLELRHHLEQPLLVAFFDKLFGIASLLLTVFFAVAIGNVLRGVNFLNPNDLYFFLPLWADFLPQGAIGVIDWFTLYFGVLGVLLLLFHSSQWIQLKTDAAKESSIVKHTNSVATAYAIVLAVSYVVLYAVVPERFEAFLNHPSLFLLVVLADACFVFAWLSMRKGRELFAFLGSSAHIFFKFLLTGVALFPILLPSTNPAIEGLTIQNASAGAYSQSVAIYWFVLGLLLICTYTFIVHTKYKGKINSHD